MSMNPQGPISAKLLARKAARAERKAKNKGKATPVYAPVSIPQKAGKGRQPKKVATVLADHSKPTMPTDLRLRGLCRSDHTPKPVTAKASEIVVGSQEQGYRVATKVGHGNPRVIRGRGRKAKTVLVIR